MCLVSVLIVDDDPVILDIITESLESKGKYILDRSSSGTEALDKVRKTSYDVLVSDYVMPEMDGLELLKKIRTFSTVPFIMMTGKGDEDLTIQAINAGVDYYLKKGEDFHFLITELIHMIDSGAEQKRSADALL